MLLGLMLGSAAMAQVFHTADSTADGAISLTELLRMVQFYNAGGLHCDPQSDDGYAPGPGDNDCSPHDADYAPADWVLSLSEVLRVVQLFNVGDYYCCGNGGEDGFCPGMGVDTCNAPVAFADAALESAVREAIGKPVGDLHPEELASPAFTVLEAPLSGISNLEGLEHCTALERLDLHGNCIADIGPVGALRQLRELNLHDNAISDVTPLRHLEQLELLWLSRNAISNIAALAENTGLDGDDAAKRWDRISLRMNPLPPNAAADMDVIESRGAYVWRPEPAEQEKQIPPDTSMTARMEVTWRGGVVRLSALKEYEGDVPLPRPVPAGAPRLRVEDLAGYVYFLPLRFALETTSCGADAPDAPGVGEMETSNISTITVISPVVGGVARVEYLADEEATPESLYAADGEKGMPPPCTPADEAGDPIPISGRLIYGDPTLPDDRAYVLLVLGDAFPVNELGDPRASLATSNTHYIPFSNAVGDSFTFFLEQEPFREFRSLLKIYRVDVVSRDNRPTDLRPQMPITRDTALRMKRKSVGFDYDQAFIGRIAGNTGIPWDKIVLIPNGDGSGTQTADFIVYSNFSPSRKMTALHEFGHGIGDLSDEYEYRHGSNPPESYPPANVTEPNAIARGNSIPAFDQIPWRHWLMQEDATCEPSHLGNAVEFGCLPGEGSDCQCGPLPAMELDCLPLPACEPDGDYVAQDGKLYGRIAWPEPGAWPSVVGLFEGAKYRRKGCYRPELRCRMRSDDDVEPGLQETRLFCRVCRENLIAQMVLRAGNVRAVSPGPAQPLVLEDGAQATLEIALHAFEDAQHQPEVLEWRVDGGVVPGAVGTSLLLQADDLSVGNHTVSVTTHNPTPWVHPGWASGQQAMRQVIAWEVVRE